MSNQVLLDDHWRLSYQNLSLDRMYRLDNFQLVNLFHLCGVILASGHRSYHVLRNLTLNQV